MPKVESDRFVSSHVLIDGHLYCYGPGCVTENKLPTHSIHCGCSSEYYPIFRSNRAKGVCTNHDVAELESVTARPVGTQPSRSGKHSGNDSQPSGVR